MGEDFQGQYQAAELAYAQGRFDDAEDIALSLLKDVENSAEAFAKNDQDTSQLSAWESTLTLLLGHVARHGRQQPKAAIDWYERSLTATEEPTLQDIARDGIRQCKTSTSPTPKTNLLQDPFIHGSTPPSQGTDQPTAMPWQDQLSRPSESNPAPQLISTTNTEAVVNKELKQETNAKQTEINIEPTTPLQPTQTKKKRTTALPPQTPCPNQAAIKATEGLAEGCLDQNQHLRSKPEAQELQQSKRVE